MEFSNSSKEIRFFIVLCFVGAAIGLVYTQLVYLSNPENTEGSIWLGFTIGLWITILSGGLEYFYVSRPFSYFRRIAFLPSLLLRVLLHLIVVILVSTTCQTIFGYFRDITPFFMRPEAVEEITFDTVFAILIMAVIVFFMQVRSLIGGRQMKNLLLGRYHQPSEQEQMFMFVDVANSAAIASKIGDIAFHRYLNALFVLFDEEINRQGGEVDSYVGDALIATWPLQDDQKKNAKIVVSADNIHRACNKWAGWFEKEFSVKPAIRIAMHSGKVVVGETGNRKKQITYLGNTVNLTARIEAKAKELGAETLVSQDLLDHCKLPDGLSVEHVGDFRLKGIAEEITLYSLAN